MKSTIRRALILAVAAVAPCTVCAGVEDQFAIDWYTIDGGGGTSSGGDFSISGGIGQPDAGGEQSGGPFGLIGGFWAGVDVVQTPGAPTLRVRRNPTTGAVVVSWNLPDDGFVLRRSPTLGQGASPWTDVPADQIQSTPEIRFVTISNPTGRRFYALFRANPVP